MQVPPRGAERASSDGVTIEEYRPVDQRRSMTTVAEIYTNFTDKSEPTLSQRSAVVAEEAGADGTTNVPDRSIDRNTMETTVLILPTDYVTHKEPTLTRVSPVVAKMAHKDGTRVMQYQSEDQKIMKTTIMQMPMDFLEIPEPTLPRGFLELAEDARNVKIESGQFCYTEDVQSQGTGLTRPVFVTVIEYSSPGQSTGATRAAGVSTEVIPTRSSAGRRKPVDRSGLVGSQNKTDQPVLTGSNEDQVGTVPTGQVGSDIIIDRIQPVAEGPVGLFGTRRPVGTDGMFSMSDSDQLTADGPVGRFITHSPVGPDHGITSDSDQPTAEGPVDQFITHSPVGPDSITSACDPDRPVADGPVGQSFIVGPGGPRRMFSPYKLESASDCWSGIPAVYNQPGGNP